jgi:hypothetical protein
MKNKLQIGKYYNHNPNHFKFARTYDMGSSYVSVHSDDEQGWIGVIFGCVMMILLVGVLYSIDFY